MDKNKCTEILLGIDNMESGLQHDWSKLHAQKESHSHLRVSIFLFKVCETLLDMQNINVHHFLRSGNEGLQKSRVEGKKK